MPFYLGCLFFCKALLFTLLTCFLSFLGCGFDGEKTHGQRRVLQRASFAIRRRATVAGSGSDMQNEASNPTEKTHGQLAKGSAKDQISSRGIFHPKDVLWIKGWWAGTGPDRRSASALSFIRTGLPDSWPDEQPQYI